MPNPNSTDTLESLATKLESTHKKLFLMKKRLDRWGLNDEEKIKLEKLSTEYLETHYKLVDLTTNTINEISSNDENHQYVLYCFQIEKKRLIAIKFEV